MSGFCLGPGMCTYLYRWALVVTGEAYSFVECRMVQCVQDVPTTLASL